MTTMFLRVCGRLDSPTANRSYNTRIIDERENKKDFPPE